MPTIIHLFYNIFGLTCLFVVDIKSSMIKGPFRIVTENLTVTSNPQWLDISAITHTDRQPEEVDIWIRVNRDFDQPIYIRGQIRVLRPGRQPLMVINGKWFDLCRFWDNTRQDLFLDIFYRMQNDYGNQINKCPVRMIEFNITGMQLKPSYFPSFFPANRYMLTLRYAIQTDAKLGYQSICDYVWFGQIKR